MFNPVCNDTARCLTLTSSLHNVLGKRATPQTCIRLVLAVEEVGHDFVVGSVSVHPFARVVMVPFVPVKFAVQSCRQGKVVFIFFIAKDKL